MKKQTKQPNNIEKEKTLDYPFEIEIKVKDGYTIDPRFKDELKRIIFREYRKYLYAKPTNNKRENKM